MLGLTEALARFVELRSFSDLPSCALNVAKTGIADCHGVMIAGSHEPLVGIIDRELTAKDGVTASLIPSREKRNAADAALVNAAAAHALDYDDVTLDGHPSAVLWPAILAQAEASHAAGRDMLTAYILGYEVWAELLAREPVPLHEKGWHPTVVRGTVASAAACAKLRGLDVERTTHALAIAASMAGGLVANFGTMTKAFQVGRAAQSGVIAARLAEAGLTASIDALEHPAGYLAAFSPKGEADLHRPLKPDKEWLICRQGLNIKRFPICYATHRSIDAILQLLERHPLQATDIERICVHTSVTQMRMLRSDRPQTGLEAKFSMQFAMASALTVRKVGLRQLTDAFVQDRAVQDLFSRVECRTTTDSLANSAFAPFDSVELIAKDGKIYRSKDVAYARGSFHNPLSREELFDKFADCVADVYPDNRGQALFEKLFELESVKDANELIDV